MFSNNVRFFVVALALSYTYEPFFAFELNSGKIELAIDKQVSYASKNAIAKVEKNGGKVNLIKI